MRIARRYVIRGFVQGVGFRRFVQACAEKRGIDGWVRNTSDGCVHAEAEGEAHAMMLFERDIRRGPAGGRVDEVDVADVPVASTRNGFHIQ
jgi:acylphosphatase